LLQCRLELIERRFVLRNLVIKLRDCELGQEIPCLDAVPNIDLALDDVAGRASIDTSRGKRGRSPGKKTDTVSGLGSTIATCRLGTKSRDCSAVAMTCCCCE
jgi:hypothetical protein